jgi:hypothetical protein
MLLFTITFRSVAHSASYSGVNDFLPWVKRPWREVKLTSSAEVKNEWSYTSTPLYAFVTENKNFAFLNFSPLQMEILSTIN